MNMTANTTIITTTLQLNFYEVAIANMLTHKNQTLLLIKEFLPLIADKVESVPDRLIWKPSIYLAWQEKKKKKAGVKN